MLHASTATPSGIHCQNEQSYPESPAPAGATVYRYDESALSYRELTALYAGEGVLRAWYRKLLGKTSAGVKTRVLHVHDYSRLEVRMGEVPSQVQAEIWQLFEHFAELGFGESRFTKATDSLQSLETISLVASHAGCGTVLLIELYGDARPGRALKLMLLTVFPDGSALVTGNTRMGACVPDGERRQVIENGSASDLWKLHTEVLAGIPYRPKSVPDANAAWEILNEYQASQLRYYLQRGVYAKRSAAECTKDHSTDLLNKEEEEETIGWAPAPVGGMSGGLTALAWLAAILAFMATICYATVGLKPKNKAAAAVVASPARQSQVAPSEAAPAAKPQLRFASRSAPGLRTPE